MVSQATIASAFNSTGTKNILLGGLTVASTVLAAISQQAWLTIVPMICLLQFKQNPSQHLQAFEKNYEVLIETFKKEVNDVIAPLTEELSQQKSVIKPQLAEGEKGRLIIVMDGNNLYHSAGEEGVRIDHKKLIAQICENASQLVSVFYFTSVDSTKPQEVRFLEYLKWLGCKVITQEVSQNAAGIKEGNLDAEIMIQMVRACEISDTIALCSGDSDFKPFVQYVKEKGGRVEVYGFDVQTSEKLKRVADKYVDLKTLKVFKDNPKKSNDHPIIKIRN
ncbi:NYN domain-containing protein [Nostoc sp. C110]|uniref:LabA-like NYN domain-containing protein n=1 Tax=Nostoc sp. C110 TaxID=3349876 RepID=UPI00370D01A6